MNKVSAKVAHKIPNIPHWRWTIISDEEEPPAVKILMDAADEEGVDLLRGLDESSDEFKKALKIRGRIPVLQTVQDMLMEKCSVGDISKVLHHKFKMNASKNDIRMYRDLFFDTRNIDNFGIAKYFEGNVSQVGEFNYQPPPVPGKWRDQYAIYENGGMPEIDPDEAIRFLFSESIFKSSEMNEMGWHGHNNKIRYSRLALEIYKELKSQKSSGVDSIPDKLKAEIVYPDSTAVNVEDVNDYDEFDDPNEVKDE